MDFIKRHMIIIVSITTFSLISLLLSQVYTAKDDITFRFIDHYGDRSSLDNITIQGELKDGYHSTHFAISKNEVSSYTEIFDYSIFETQPRRYMPGLYIPLELDGIEYEFRISNSGFIGTFDISYDKVSFSSIQRMGYTSLNTTTPGSTSTNHLEYGLTSTGENIYFMVPNTSDFKGKNSIYELALVETENIPRTQLPESRKVTTYSFEQNTNPDLPKLSVLGLESVNDNLVVVMQEGDKLLIKGVSTSGEELGTAYVEQFFSEDRESENHYPSYKAYENEEDDIITLNFDSNLGDTNHTIASFSLSNGVEVVDVVRTDFLNEKFDSFHSVEKMIYKNNKLYVARTVREAGDENYSPPEVTQPIYFYIYVFEDSELLYKGELVTDNNDDLIQIDTLTNYAHGISYSFRDYRNFMNISFD
ncbi:hypothetical protein ACERII_06195 [Evansella sp. AB-rgal1]|uniref:hypothetical protein n=1 Tax=Evansella sp. AB-rgal1 TaxID=3242696 RepID=UPI00359D9783